MVLTEPSEEGEADPFQDETVIAAARCLPMWSDGAAPFVPSEEIAAAKGLQAECMAQLQGFETAVEEDLQQLKGELKCNPAEVQGGPLGPTQGRREAGWVHGSAPELPERMPKEALQLRWGMLSCFQPMMLSG